MRSLASGGEMEGISLPHLKGWQDHPFLLHSPRAPSAPLKYPPTPCSNALALGPPTFEPSTSGPPYPGPPAPDQTSSYWISCSWISSSHTSSKWTPSFKAASIGASQARQGLLYAKPQLPRNYIAVPSLQTISEKRFQVQHCEYSFKN